MNMQMNLAPCYVVDGMSEVEASVPVGHVVVCLRGGIRPTLLELPDKARSVMVGPMDDNDMRGLPIVLLVIPPEHVEMFERASQALIDELVSNAVQMLSPKTCAGSA
jgi:hypothetical protein